MIHIQLSLRRFLAVVHIFAMALIVAACPMYAQLAGTGSIQGTVTDPTGAVLPNAKVLLTNADTQVRREAVSDSGGVYNFANIDVGTYSVSVTAQGFETYTRTRIVLEVGSSISVNIGMVIGATETRVEVQSEGLSLQTEDPSFKQTIDQTTITEMPLNGRRMTDLIGLSGGSSPAPGGDFTGSKYSYAAISVSIAGGNGNTTQWRLDGGDNNDYMANANLPFPFPDAVNQFSVESTALGARGGSHSGGLVNVVTRSGTNTYHGSAFDFFRNNYINATNFFSVCTPVAPATTCVAPKDSLHQNQMGGTFGGKILRDKLFAFAGFQFSRQKQGQATSSAHVPTPANLKGDFSVSDPIPQGSTGTLVNPITGVALLNNQIDPTTFNAQALALVKYLPQAGDGTGLVSYSIPLWVFDKQFISRVDYTINPKNDMYARYMLDGYQAPGFFNPTNILVTTQPGNIERVQTFVIGEDFSFSSNTVNSFHASLARRSNVRGPAPGITACTLGVQLNCPLPLSTGLQITVGTTSTHGFSAYCGTCAPGHFNDNTLAFNDDITLVRGKHEMVFGAELARNQLNIVGGFQANGNFGFNGQYSKNGPGGGSAIGDANLDFLMGAMSSYSQSKTQQNALRGWIPSVYFQDTFHPTKNLTVVAGLRWQPEFIPVDFFNRGSIFDYSAFLANKVSTVYPGAPAGSFFYGDPGVSRQFTQNSPWQFSPNLGLSYDPTGSGKTVLRAGAGIAYDEVNFFTGQRVNQNPPFATSSSPNTSGQLSFTSPWTVGGVLNNPYSQPQPPVPSAANAVFPVQGQFIVFPKHFHPSYTIQYTASIQHQFGKGWQMQIDYIGNGTRHAPIGSPFNDAVFIPGVWGANGTGCDPIVKTGPAAVKAGAAGTPCSTIANAKNRYALAIANPLQGNQYQGGGGGSVMVGDYATANYNGLVTTLQHRLSSRFSLLANWTWSKCLNEADGNGDITGSPVSNASNIAQDYGPCGSDYRHIENIVIVTQSKFALSGWKAFALNGWEFAPLIHIQSGAPINVTQGSDVSLTSNGNDRPILVPGVPIYVPFGHRNGASGLPAAVIEANRGYLNQAAFISNTVGGTYGNISRNQFRGIPTLQFDAQVSRIFPIHERMNMDLRLEAFNVLNHPNFNNPSSSNPSSTSFGQISGAGTARIFQVGAKFSF